MDKHPIWKRLFRFIVLGGLMCGMPAPGGAGDMPESLHLDSLSHLYEGVSFDHLLHADIAGGCSACHHHVAGERVEDENCARCHSNSEEAEIVSCSACHPVEPFSAEYLRQKEMDAKRFHRDTPGLKAAYHQNCLGCHNEMGGPTGCVDCHPRTEAGDAFFRSGAHAPKPGAGGGHH